MHYIFYSVTTDHDILISMVDEAMKWLSKASVPGMYLANFMPWHKSAH